MSFQPEVGLELRIGGHSFCVAEHPAAPGMPYGQEGRAAVVYRLDSRDGRDAALKVFRPRHRVPSMALLAGQIAPYAELPGLDVCRRTVLTPQEHGVLLRQHPDLLYGVLMPWIEGPTWAALLLDRVPLTQGNSLSLARSLSTVLATMEQNALAHCDLSGGNILLPELAEGEGVCLVDVEGMYGPGLMRPDEIMSASPGYAHRTAPQGIWGPEADRFSSAVMLAEMLGWCDGRVRDAAVGDPAYFAADDLQQPSERYQILVTALGEQWGKAIAQLFERSWRSETLWDCPAFEEWLLALAEDPPAAGRSPRATSEAESQTQVLLQQAENLEEQGDPAAALDIYRQVIEQLPARHSLARELAFVVQELALQLAREAAREQSGASELKTLYVEGVQAYESGDWQVARELLREIVRRSPEYVHDGQTAATLLAKAERRLALEGFLSSGRMWMGIAALALMAVVICGGVAIGLHAAGLFPGSGGPGRSGNDQPAQVIQVTAAPLLPEATPQVPETVAETNGSDSETTEADDTETPRLSEGGPEPTATIAEAEAPTTTTETEPAVTVSPTEEPLRIAYVMGPVGNTDVYVADRDGRNRICVACRPCDEAEPAWSPDGQSVVYQSNCEGSYDIWRVDAQGGTPIRLTETANVDEREPDWSLSDRIAYRTSLRDQARNSDGELWIMNNDGTGNRSLGIRGRSPIWSPNGMRIVFMSERDGSWEIFLYDYELDGTHKLTNCSTNCRWPAWSPDGRFVIYHSTTAPGSVTADTIWTVSVETDAITQLVVGQAAGRPSWSAEGLVVFNSDRGVEVVNDRGQGRRVLINNNDNWAPVWSR